ncbi:pyridoxal phosphate-dependent transferase [Scleroderma yunnanense]
MLPIMDLRVAQWAEEFKCDVHTKTQEEDNDARRAEISRTFISDTITVPTKDMYEYAVRASLGDDVSFEPETCALQSHIAKLTGKEAGLFMPTGTMSNQVALRTHLQQPPYSVICDARAHAYRNETGGIAFHSGANVIPIFPDNDHHLTWEDIEPRIICGTEVHSAPTRVILLENTLNGTVIPQQDVLDISKNVREKDIVMHLDGARIWHVVVATGMSLKDLCEPFDSVSLCFSKGLGAPIGSCLVGTKEFITRAKWFRKLFGGGMRQTGYLAAAAAYGLTHNFPLLPQVHGLANRMQHGLEEIGVGILTPAETCMVFYDPSPIGVEYWEVVERAAQLPNPIHINGSRLIMHIQTSPEAIEDFLELMKTLKIEKGQAGWSPDKQPRPARKGIYRDPYVKAVRPMVTVAT